MATLIGENSEQKEKCRVPADNKDYKDCKNILGVKLLETTRIVNSFDELSVTVEFEGLERLLTNFRDLLNENLLKELLVVSAKNAKSQE